MLSTVYPASPHAVKTIKRAPVIPSDMVVKAVRGRRRYVVFTVPEEAGRTEVLDAFSEIADSMPDLRVITSFEGKAIIRCSPGE